MANNASNDVSTVAAAPVNNEKVEVRYFQFQILKKHFLDENRKVKNTTVKDFIVGDRDVIFDVVFSETNDDLLDIKLVRTSQRLKKVNVSKCRIYSDNMLSLTFVPTTLKARSELVKESTVELEDCWTSQSLKRRRHDADVDQPSICIAGMISYNLPSDCLQKELELLLNDKKTSDVEIIVDDVTFASHKCLLSARSSAFRAMFNSGLKESDENVVKLPYDDPEVFEQALQYMYTDFTPQLSTMVLDLLVLADKYDIKGLLHACEEEMIKTMNTENVCDYMVKSTMINSNRIYTKCLDYFNSKKAEVVITEGFRRLNETRDSAKILSDIVVQISSLPQK